MAMFGNPNGLQFNDSELTVPLTQTQPMTAPQIPTMPDNRRWMDGGKFTWKDGLGLALGAIGDAFTRQPMTANMVNQSFQHRRALEEAEKQRAADREANRSDWLWKLQQERNNPQPRYFESNSGDQYMIGPDGKPQMLFKDPTPKTEWITAKNADGTMSIIPIGPNGPMIGGSNAAPSLPAIGTVMPDPRKAGGAGSGPRPFP